MSRRATTLLAASAMALAVLGGQITTSVAGSRAVIAQDIAFAPRTVTIRAGSSIIFKFLDPDTEHNVISFGTKRFASINDRAIGSVKRTFRRGGIYRYECTLHPGMTGRINVR